MGEVRSIYRILAGKTLGKRLFGRPRRGWKNNIKIYVKDDSSVV
jgi:hypothetical protein